MPPLISLITCRAELHCFAWSFVSHVDVRWLLVSYQAFVVLCCRCWCVLSWIKASERFPSLLGSVVTEQVLLCQVNLSTNIYCERLEEITDLKIFPECFQGHWKHCGGSHAARRLLIAHPSITIQLHIILFSGFTERLYGMHHHPCI